MQWLKFTLFLCLALSNPAEAKISVGAVNCLPQNEKQTHCDISLLGKAEANELLYLNNVQDIDVLKYNGSVIDRTGYAFGQVFYARFFPRFYSLTDISGVNDPKLSIDIQEAIPVEKSAQPSARIINSSERWGIVWHALVWRLLAAALALFFISKIPQWIELESSDGWRWDRRANEIFFISGALLSFMFSEWPRLFVPSLILGSRFLFVEKILASILVWSLSGLLLDVHFNDPSSIEKYRSRRSALKEKFNKLISLGFIVALIFLASNGQRICMMIQAVSLLVSLAVCLQRTEWQRIFKRSHPYSTLYFLSLVGFAYSILFTTARSLLGKEASLTVPIFFTFISLAAAYFRIRLHINATAEMNEFVEECRAEMQQEMHGAEKLARLCNIVQEEWALARVSLLAVHVKQGLLLASAGPHALTLHDKNIPRKLGPFLRRACKERHLLYAPVAEELELLDKDLRHSSIAIPILRGKDVEAVLCLMAQEDMRISPQEAMIIEISGDALGGEILTAVRLALLEQQREQFAGLIQKSHGPLLEEMNPWGFLDSLNPESRKIVIRAEASSQLFSGERVEHSRALKNTRDAYNAELFAIWSSFRDAFEFLSIEKQEESFWLVSPKEFKSPLLKNFSAEQAALLLAHLLQKQAELLLQNEAYRMLGACGARIVVGAGSACVKQDAMHSELLLKLSELSHALPSQQIAVDGSDQMLREALTKDPLFRSGRCNLDLQNSRYLTAFAECPDIYSLLGLNGDKKELRKLETLALELARERLKRPAA